MRHWTVILLSFLFLLGTTTLSSAQTSDTLAKSNKLIPLPTISVNVGINHGFTDVELADGPTPFRQLGYQLTITQRAAKFLNVSLELYSGSLYGEEQRGTTNINYRTSLFSQHLNVEYNFYPLLKPKPDGRQLIRPYVGFGIGAVFFRSKGDLQDKSGNTYNYWEDGNIYAEPEGTIDVSESTLLERDFEYETDLRDANLDGFRKYSQTAFTMPINAGIRFQVSKHVGLNASFAYVLNFTDMIDNVSSKSVGVRAGNSAFDNHLFGSIGLSIFLGNTRPSVKPIKSKPEVLADDSKTSSSDELIELEVEEVSESNEEDITKKDIANSEEVKSSEPAIEKAEANDSSETTDETEPVTTTSEPTADQESSNEVTSNKETAAIDLTNLANSSPKETAGFHWADLNGNGWISPDEVLHFIDLLFEGEAVRTVSDIQDLIDYYFDQE